MYNIERLVNILLERDYLISFNRQIFLIDNF